jgi:DNA-binding response OmpR family regulator
MKKILVVDDDFEIISLVTEILEKEGYQVESALEASTGMQKAREGHPDLIIIDFHMPGSNGAHLFENLRRNSSSALTPILFISGEVSQEEIFLETCDSEGCRFLAKPVSIEDLRKTIHEMLEGK